MTPQRKQTNCITDPQHSGEWLPDGLPFAHLNLHQNPFGTVSAEDRVQLAVVDHDGAAHLRNEKAALQLVGKRGRGKTTHLRAIEHRLSDVPTKLKYARQDEVLEGPEVPVPFVDEFQRVDAHTRHRFYRNADRIAIATHNTFTDELEAQGYNVRNLKTGVDDVDQLKKIIDRRIEWARRDEGPVPELTRRDVRTLNNQFGTDLRSLFEHLYNVFQKLEEPGRVQL